MNKTALEVTRNRMTLDHIESLIITNMSDIKYYINRSFHPGERFAGLIITRDRLIFMVNKLFPQGDIEGVEVIYYMDTQNPMQIIQDLLKPSTTVGIDKFMYSHFLLTLQNLRSDLTYVLGSNLVDQVKMVKSKEEIELMIRASGLNDLAMSKVRQVLLKAKGKTELEIASEVKRIHREVGAEGISFEPIVCFGPNAAEPHHENDHTVLEDHMAILIDMGGIKNGYCSDMTRTFYKGQADDEFLKVYELVKRANEKAIEKVKPGVKLSDIDLAARGVIEAAGYGEFFTHRTGHGIGQDVHEFPDVSLSSDVICQPGMIFSIEPGIYIQGKFGVRIEDLVCVTEDGCLNLNKYSKNLINFE